MPLYGKSYIKSPLCGLIVGEISKREAESTFKFNLNVSQSHLITLKGLKSRAKDRGKLSSLFGSRLLTHLERRNEFHT